MNIWPIYLKIGPNWPNRQCCLAGSSKTAPRIFIFSIVLGAENLSYVKSIETHARAFLALNILAIGSVFHFSLESWGFLSFIFFSTKLKIHSEIKPPLKPASQTMYIPLLCMHLTYLLNCAIQQIKYNFPIYQKISGLRPHKGPLILDHIFVLSLVQ